MKHTELIERLRAGSGGMKHWQELESEAADAIESLQAEVERLTQSCNKAAQAELDLLAERDTLKLTPKAMPAETRTLWECRGCGHLHGEKVSSCDCMENGANEYNEWVAAPKGAV